MCGEEIGIHPICEEYASLFLIFNMKKLSIYVDESGVFGTYDSTKPYYLFTLLFIEEETNNQELELSLIHELDLLDYGSLSFHAGPIIRKEKEFSELSIEVRRKIFNKMTYFAARYKYEYKTFLINRKQYFNESLLYSVLLKQLLAFLLENLQYFSRFDTIVYYDNGQKQLKSILKQAFTSVISSVAFKTVISKDSYLLQLADYLTTLELIEQKYINKDISLSEIYFFGSHTNFKRNYYKQIAKKRIKETLCHT